MTLGSGAVWSSGAPSVEQRGTQNLTQSKLSFLWHLRLLLGCSVNVGWGPSGSPSCSPARETRLARSSGRPAYPDPRPSQEPVEAALATLTSLDGLEYCPAPAFVLPDSILSPDCCSVPVLGTPSPLFSQTPSATTMPLPSQIQGDLGEIRGIGPCGPSSLACWPLARRDGAGSRAETQSPP